MHVGLLLTTILIGISHGQCKELKFVQAVWRHGHRAPGELPYPSDKNGLNVWKRGWSQLSTLGMQQLAELGRFFAQRYKGKFVSDTFNISEIYVQASDSDRAIESAQCFLLGFFPPQRDELFDQGLNWRPLPVHTSGAGQADLINRPTSYDCVRHEKLADSLANKLYKNLTKQYNDVYEFIRTNAGYSNSSYTWKDAIGVSSAIREQEFNLTIDPWLLKRWSNYENKTTLELATEWNKLERFTDWGTQELTKLRGGYLLNDWLNKTLQAARGELDEPSKMLLHSAHDGTILTLLHALNTPPDEISPYASAVIWELYQNNNQSHVEIYYRSHGKLAPLTVPGCKFECPVDDLVKALSENIVESPEQVDELCENPNDGKKCLGGDKKADEEEDDDEKKKKDEKKGNKKNGKKAKKGDSEDDSKSVSSSSSSSESKEED